MVGGGGMELGIHAVIKSIEICIKLNFKLHLLNFRTEIFMPSGSYDCFSLSIPCLLVSTKKPLQSNFIFNQSYRNWLSC